MCPDHMYMYTFVTIIPFSLMVKLLNTLYCVPTAFQVDEEWARKNDG